MIGFEIEKRKLSLELLEINKKLKTLKDAENIRILKDEKSDVSRRLKESNSNRSIMKRRFDEYIKRSGYSPPKSKNKKR